MNVLVFYIIILMIEQNYFLYIKSTSNYIFLDLLFSKTFSSVYRLYSCNETLLFIFISGIHF